MPDDVGRGRFDAVGNEDSLLSHVEVAAGAISSILRDSNLKKVDALSIREALVLTLQGTASVSPSTFVDPFPYCFRLLIDSFLFFGRWLLKRRALLIEPKHIYEFMTLLPKDYCLIPGNGAIKLVSLQSCMQGYDTITKGLLTNPRQRRHKTC